MPLPTSRRAETSRLRDTVSASRRRRKVDPKERFSLRGYGHRATVNTVYVLGAGFSRAVSSRMPLITDLTSNLRETHSSYFDGVDTPVIRNNVESLLTFLATPQPWLSREQQLVNLSRFHGLAHAIADLIGERENETLDSPAPDWLIALVELWGSEQATVITLNYDVLVEKAVCSGQPKETQSAGFTSLYAVPATPLHHRAATLIPEAGRSICLNSSGPTVALTGVTEVVSRSTGSRFTKNRGVPIGNQTVPVCTATTVETRDHSSFHQPS